jgi:hypothetical protein
LPYSAKRHCWITAAAGVTLTVGLYLQALNGWLFIG